MLKNEDKYIIIEKAQKTYEMQNNGGKIDEKSRLQQNRQSSFAHSLGSSRSNTKFIIRYDERQICAIRTNNNPNRYSAKYQFNQIRQKKIPQSVLEKNRAVSNNGAHMPSYLRPTEASISAQLQRNRIASLADMNSAQNKTRSIAKLRSKSLEGQENQQQKQYNRIPIQFYDERNHGCGADYIRARVVYRGYAPKNTYYYMKTLKPYKRKIKKTLQSYQSTTSAVQQIVTQKSQLGITPFIPNVNSVPSLNFRYDLEIRFQSKFQSGNLSAAARISNYQYWLYMRQDTNTHGLRQWYYFAATNKKQIKVKFRIYKFTKSYSLYRIGMRPYIRIVVNDSLKQWQQAGEKVKYEYDSSQRCFYLQFQYKFEEDNQEVQFAMLPPYTYSMLRQYMRKLQTINQQQNQDLLANGQNQKQLLQKSMHEQYNQIAYYKQPQIKINIVNIGQTLAGLDISLIQIKKKMSKHELNCKNREAIVVLARTHPGETVSNFSLESFIDTIVQSRQIIQFYDFYIVPMVNPDGVYFGNHRTSVIGQDLNRNFNNNDFQIFPQIQAVHSAVNRAKRSHKIRFLIDLHGHSARKNIFAYGDEHEICSQQYLHSRILPKLLNDNISSFKYDYCIFKQSKQKKNTARVFYSSRFKINCVTIQQSYGILDEGPIGIKVWRNFGIALANSILQFANMYKQGKQNALQQYLTQQIQKQKQDRQRIIQKHRKIFAMISETKPKQQQNQAKPAPVVEQVKQKTIQQAENVIIQNIVNEQDQNIQQKRVEQQIIIQEQVIQKQQEDKNQEEEQKSINMSQLSSGDEELQIKNQQIQAVKKDIYKLGCLKEGLKRQIYNVADKKLELFDPVEPGQKQQSTYRRLHEQKSSMIPRIAKLQQKRKDDYNLSFKRQFRQNQRDLLQKQRQIRKKQIQIRFKRMELPSIKK